MESREEFKLDQRTYKLTKLWLALFLFAVTINAVPYLPFWPEEESAIQVVMQTNHATICSSAAVRAATPRSNSSLLVEGISGTIPDNFKVQDQGCVLLESPSISSTLFISDIFIVQSSKITKKVYSAAHPSRGPPRI
jgi:hypothetical protein